MGRRNDDRLWLTPEEVADRRAEFDRRRRAWRSSSPGPAPTIGSVRKNSEWMWVNCEAMGCGHRAAVPLAPLIIRWGPDAPWSYMRRMWLCTRCGGRKTSTTMPSWGGLLVGFMTMDDRLRWTGSAVWPEPLSMHFLEDGRVYGANFDEHFHPVLGQINFGAMCNLYSNTRSREAVRAWFGVSANRAYAFEPMPAIFPKSVAPIVRVAEDGEREMVPATWGFPLLKQGYAPKPVTNVRDDKILTSPFWRPSFEGRRCLVPASSYCEPDSNSPAAWHWFALKDESEDRPLFAFPGVWKRYRGPMKKDGEPVEVDVYAFMTTSPNALTATIMHDRMPVLLSEEADFETWLTGAPEQAYALVRTYPAERMRIAQSGREKLDLIQSNAAAP